MAETIPILITVLLSVLYTGVFAIHYRRWIKIDFSPSPAAVTELPFLSIVAPFRNEEHNMEKFLQSIDCQKYPNENFELIAVDDHSEDRSVELLTSRQKDLSFSLKLIRLGNGIFSKKRALSEGIDAARGDLIVTTDVDCHAEPGWLNAIGSRYSSSRVQMLIGPVEMTGNDTLLQSIQIFEFAALQMITATSAFADKAVLCNGSNLVFEKSSFRRINGFESNLNSSSGDDLFMLHQLKKDRDHKIAYLPLREAIIRTEALSNIKSVLEQRIRWASKMTKFNDRELLVFEFIGSAANLWAITLPIVEWMTSQSLMISVLYLSAKMFIDFAVVKKVFEFYDRRVSTMRFLAGFISYPFYFFLILLLSVFRRPEWKGRRISI